MYHDYTVSGDCPAGHFADKITCKKCPKGQFQDKPGQSSCKNCSQGYSTQDVASKNISDCIRKNSFIYKTKTLIMCVVFLQFILFRMLITASCFFFLDKIFLHPKPLASTERSMIAICWCIHIYISFSKTLQLMSTLKHIAGHIVNRISIK